MCRSALIVLALLTSSASALAQVPAPARPGVRSFPVIVRGRAAKPQVRVIVKRAEPRFGVGTVRYGTYHAQPPRMR